MEPLDIAALEPEEPFDIVSPAEACANAAPAIPALNIRASPVILADRSIRILLGNNRIAAVDGAPHAVELRNAARRRRESFSTASSTARRRQNDAAWSLLNENSHTKAAAR